MNMIVEIQVTQLLTWNFARSITYLRYFSDQLVDVTRFIYSNFLKEQSTNLYSKAFFFKENVRYPVWICRDPIYLILGTRFSLILGTR